MTLLRVLGRIFLILLITAIAVGVSCGGTIFIGLVFSKGVYDLGPYILAAIVSTVVGILTFIWSIWKNNYIVTKVMNMSTGNIGKALRVIIITVLGLFITYGGNMLISDLIYYLYQDIYISEGKLTMAAVIETIIIFISAVWFYFSRNSN